MRTMLTAITALLVTGAAAAQPTFADRFKAATAAYQAHDYARMETEFRAALALRPGHPAATYNLASALCLGGKPAAAVEALATLADAGLAFDPGADADFASLKDDRAFAGLQRRFARNLEPQGSAEPGFSLASPSFIPEGIAWDARRKQFYVGSVHERRIQRVLRDGTEQEFIKPGAGLWAVLGMAVDPARDLLWAATAAIDEMRDAAAGEVGRTAIVAYDLASGSQKHRFVLDDGPGPRQFGDLLVHGDTIFATDSRGGALYALDVAGGKFRALTPAGALRSPQGLALARDGRHLYVADYPAGLFRYALEGGALEPVAAAAGVSLYGIDGLYRSGNGLIAVQNGVRPHRVVRIELDKGGRRAVGQHVLAANLEAFDEPTLGVLAEGSFWFVANSQWNKFREDHTLPPVEQLRRPQVLRISLAAGS